MVNNYLVFSLLSRWRIISSDYPQGNMMSLRHCGYFPFSYGIIVHTLLEWGIILPVEYSNEAITRYCSCGMFVLFWWKTFGVILVMLPCHLLNDSSVTIVLCQIVLWITSQVMCKSVVIRRVDYKKESLFIFGNCVINYIVFDHYWFWRTT